jgi:hypothetical protein
MAENKDSPQRATYIALGLCVVILVLLVAKEWRSPAEWYDHAVRALPAVGIGLLALSAVVRGARPALVKLLCSASIVLACASTLAFLR